MGQPTFLGISNSNKCLLIDKLLVTTGRPGGNGRYSEVIDVSNERNQCDNLENFPYDVLGPAGTYLNGNIIVCGNYWGTNKDKCYFLGQDKYITMSATRGVFSGIIVGDKVRDQLPMTIAQEKVHIFHFIAHCDGMR